MKLRNRTKRVLPNIKQEDCKPVLTPGEASTFIATKNNTPNLTIKQEDTKEHKALLKQRAQSIKDYLYQCDMCDQKLANLQSVLEHRESIHNVKNKGSRMIKDMNMQPDIHDPDFYCKSCERGYQSKSKYRDHLKRAHFMALKQLPRHKVPSNDVLPDPDDPNLYCRACNFTYKHGQTYQNHCRYVHGTKPVDSANGKSTSGIMMDTYCQDCDSRLSSIYSYRHHLFAVHQKTYDIATTQQKKLLPDANDPNFYCRSCEKRLASKYSFKLHLMAVHSIFQSAPRKRSRLAPIIADPSNYCRACQKNYPSKSKYRNHLRIVHQMAPSRLIGKAKHTKLPDPYNPDHYCSACKKAFASLRLYRKHCKYVHLMVLGPSSIVNPAATIDSNNPNHYCSQCEHTFSSKYSFKKHLRKVHHV